MESDKKVGKSDLKESTTSMKDKGQSVLETHGISVLENIGHGSYASVKSAYSSTHGCKVAVKVVSKRTAPEDYIVKFLPREIQVVKLLKHPNVICFLQAIETTSRVYLIMEIADNGDLLDFIKDNGAVPETQAGTWFHQLVNGMDYCHKHGVVHRDLKCENLLLNKDKILKITDFGFARSNMKPPEPGRTILSETYCGSYAYAPPEILRGIPYCPMLGDIWSMGVILYTMMFGRLPYDDTNHKLLLNQIQRPPGFPNKAVQSDCKDLICRILSPAKRRINMVEIQQETWYRRVSLSAGKSKKSVKKQSGVKDQSKDKI